MDGERVRQDAPVGALTLDVPAEPVRRSSNLVVGAADDRAEREADRVADQVIATLGGSATPTTDEPGGSGRIRRAASAAPGPIGLGGGALDGDTASRVQRARGGGEAIGGDVRRRMETGFGTDLSHVRIHRGTEASALNEAMSAQAFTVGNDVFMHDSSPAAGTSAGDHLLAHEIAHTMQDGGPGVHRLWSIDQFKKQTSEGVFTGKSTAQKQIELHLTSYRKAAGKGVSVESNQEMVDLVLEMRGMAEAWIASHTIDTDDGNATTDPNRQLRMAGMVAFRSNCDDELRQLATQKSNLGSKAKVEVGDLVVQRPSEGAAKVIEHYDTRDVSSAFRRLGDLIDAAAPMEGDEAKINLSVKVPVPPGYVGFEFGASVAREDKHVSVNLNLGVVGGGTTALAKAGGALGGYLKVSAKNGADAAELLSYALFRRSRQSNLVPREIENKLWGGSSSPYGWQKAEKWSLDVEKRIFESDDKSFVETGAYGSVNVEAGVGDVLKLGGSAKGNIGTRIDQKSLQERKGGAGAKNLKSGADQNAVSKDYAKDNVRGAQKSVGVGVAGTTLSFTVAGGPLAASVGLEFTWRATGAHGSAKQVELKSVKLLLEGSFTVPGNVSPLATIIPNLVKLVNQKIQSDQQSLEPDVEDQPAGLAAEGVTSMARAMASLATISKDPWKPFEATKDKAGLGFEGTTKYTISGNIGGEWDGGVAKTVGGVSINQTDNSSLTQKAISAVKGVGDVATDVVKFEVEKTIRLCKIAYDGSAWSIAWAGNPYGK